MVALGQEVALIVLQRLPQPDVRRPLRLGLTSLPRGCHRALSSVSTNSASSGAAIVDPLTREEAKVRAFLEVPLYQELV